MKIKQILTQRVIAAMTAAGIPEGTNPAVALSNRPQFGEYQANGVLGAAKALKTNPRELANKVVAELDLTDIAEKVEIAGPGFINIFLSKDWLNQQMMAAKADERLTIATADQAQTCVVDYSSPNLAKEMHVGHLRSTIIGDAIARTLEFQGHKVVRQNHMGDWGTQFGMLIAHLEDNMQGGNIDGTALADLEVFYREAKKRFDEEDNFADRARDYVVKLQGGDERCTELWQKFIEVSVSHSEDIYNKLNVTLTRDDIKPESAYNDRLAPVIENLQKQGLAVEDQGAQVVFLEEMANKDGEPMPVIVQKSGGGFLYATTDLAALEYRSQTLDADRSLYFIDARQSLHMQQVFTIAKKSGLASEKVSLEHHPFGTMMGEDGKPFKTRAGGTVKLVDLLDESVTRAAELLSQRETDLTAEQQAEVARKVGIGAVKFADLSKHRTSDYIFSWKTMLSFEGATAPYLQYAYTRVQSIFNKAGIDASSLSDEIVISQEQERTLAIKLAQFEDTLELVAKEALPHQLCAYLYEVASGFMSFYEACPILKDDVTSEEKNTRLILAKNTAATLKLGLDLLGIEVMDKM
ncbi:arginine--tRNA ligase [Catenovulum sp. SM1970]|uniref:arginine--tRNA ligase n=1 Tax=Marinifaba aquimaris TaxID=2741323 RepID=UPI0015733F41|nr:arginine--tRNA ligase [Marinifaba aquimaris]NTS78267.1 arginine--tRNA ligase [Marinifaba aquimaris]